MKFPDLTKGLCREVGVQLFYPEDGGSGTDIYMLARTICNRCEVRQECLEWALRHEDWGMWGGLTPVERKRLRSKLKIRLEEVLTKDYV